MLPTGAWAAWSMVFIDVRPGYPPYTKLSSFFQRKVDEDKDIINCLLKRFLFRRQLFYIKSQVLYNECYRIGRCNISSLYTIIEKVELQKLYCKVFEDFLSQRRLVLKLNTTNED
jgi:hypothetical protein